MFSHVMVGSSNLERSRRFYDGVLGTLGAAPGFAERHRVFWRLNNCVFAASLPINGESQSVGNGSTIGFTCDSPGKVDEWHSAGIEGGGMSCEDPPGVRQGPFGPIYAAYLRDPDGNKLCVSTAC